MQFFPKISTYFLELSLITPLGPGYAVAQEKPVCTESRYTFRVLAFSICITPHLFIPTSKNIS